MAMLHLLVVVTAIWTVTFADYSCVCNYSVERKVFQSPNTSSAVIGYMYEFDCKKTVDESTVPKFAAVEFQHKLGYVLDNTELNAQICQGNPPASDLLSTTTKQRITSPTTQTSKPATSASHSVASQTHTAASTASLLSSTKYQTSTLKATSSPSTRATPSSTPVPTTTTSQFTATLPSTTTTAPTTQTTRSTTSVPTTTTTTPTTTLPSTTTTSPTTQTTPSTTPVPTTTTTTPTSTLPSTTTTSPTTQTTASTTPIPTTTLPKQTTTTTTPTTTLPSTTTTSPTTTMAPLKVLNVSNSPLKFIGIGYNVLDANPGALPGAVRGFVADKRIFQLTQAINKTDGMATEVDVTSHSSCTKHNWSSFIHDGNSYRKELENFINFGDTSSVISTEAFLYNAEFTRVRHATEGDGTTVYRDRVSTCSLSSLRYRDDMANTSHFTITRGFATDVCNLTAVHDTSKYMTFLDKWGTSIVMSADVGTLTVERSKTNAEAILNQLRQSGHTRLIYPSKGYKGYGSSITINSTAIDNIHLPRFESPLKTSVVGSQKSPAPIEISLASITAAFNLKYWTQVIEQRLYTDVCSDVMTESVLRQIGQRMHTALQLYVAYRRSTAPYSKALKDYPIQIPMVWPSGTYGLMKPTSGCPGSKVPWGEGYRKYDTEDSGSNNYFSANVQQYLAGDFDSNDIKTIFCMKTVDIVDHVYTRAWPSGSYCLLKRAGCPTGFKDGFVYWDDADFSNKNEANGILPDGKYDHNTKMYYCCRDDGSLSNAILLPREKPFVLIRYGSSCQAVYGMDVTEVIIRWDDADLFNSDEDGGSHPFDDGGSKDHKLHFCHYREKPTGINPGIIG